MLLEHIYPVPQHVVRQSPAHSVLISLQYPIGQGLYTNVGYGLRRTPLPRTRVHKDKA
jgi:hypothetical protein